MQILDVVPFADSVTKLTARCTYCQQEAEAEAAGTGRRPLAPANHAHGAAPGGSAPSPAKHAHGHTAGASEGGQPHGAQHAQAAALHSGGQPGPRPALFSLRIAADSRQEVVGGADKYAPVCRHHYLRLSKVQPCVQGPCWGGLSKCSIWRGRTGLRCVRVSPVALCGWRGGGEVRACGH